MSQYPEKLPSTETDSQDQEHGDWYDGETIKYFSIDEADKILSLVSEWYQLIYLFLFETATRIQEARAVRIRDIDFRNNTLRANTLKQRKEAFRIIPISDRLKSMILMHQVADGLTSEDFVLARKPGLNPISRQVIHARHDPAL